MKACRWVMERKNRDRSTALAGGLGISPVTAQLLLNRGVTSIEKARIFLQPRLEGLHDPLLLDDMAQAVERVDQAIKRRERIALFGDYDVDGTTGTALLYGFFRLLGADVEYYIPHRIEEGYGLNATVVDGFSARHVTVLITIDCGTSNFREIARAREHGIDVIVLDHHEAPATLPAAHAIVNPKRPGSRYPFTGISSVGLAFKLAWSLFDRLSAPRKSAGPIRDFLFEGMGLAALGTIADVSPIVDENRIFVCYGLEAIASTRNKGMQGLLAQAGLAGKKIDAFEVAFKLAPRLNAGGRLDTARQCVELFVDEDEVRLGEILRSLEEANRRRQKIERSIKEQAMEQVRQELDLSQDRVIVVADERWHLGVVGIVAARLVDTFYRPALVLAIDRQSGLARGSARSIDGFALHEALAACSDALVSYGGHAMAAGLSLERKNLPRFRAALNEHAVKALRREDFQPKIRIDDEISLSALTPPLVREIGRLAPHGVGNPDPLFSSTRVRLAGEPRLMGHGGDHLSVHVTQGNGSALRAVGFGMGMLYDDLCRARLCSLAFTPVINEWQGKTSVELRLKDVRIEE